MAAQQWQWLEQQYSYIVLHSFVVMPNHVHGIIEIDDSMIQTGHVRTSRDLSVHDLSLPQPITKIKSLSQLMGAYKTTSSKQIHLAGLPDFKWQRSFHDHIIRNEESYQRIVNYIQNNPRNWKEDSFYTG